MTATSDPLPSTATDDRRHVNAVITILVENGLDGYILQRVSKPRDQLFRGLCGELLFTKGAFAGIKLQ